MKKRRKKPLPKKSFIYANRTIIISIIIFLLCIGGFIFYKFVSSRIISIVETPKTEMKKIPSDVKEKLSLTVFRVPILMYHYVEYVKDKKDTIRQSLDITPYTFEQQVKTLQNAGFTFMTARELGEVIDGKMELPKSPILLTFDDGHWDFDTVVLPILKKYNVKATAYIIAGFIGRSDFMSKEELVDVINSKLVDVGAHTVHHVSLKRRPSSLLNYEIGQSKSVLENTYHLSVVSFAYPGGAFDQKAIDAVKDAGFTTAVSTIPGIIQSSENRFFLYRLRPGYRTGDVLLNYLSQNTFKAY
jgi:peptidoglycan/xylan/chitin deacetylase (PgdA/CDA1 family)